MTNYTKSTNFATKDTLTSGDPLKIVKGTEINTEFDAISTAIATKADTASPTFTGTVTIPTAAISSGTINSSTIGATTPSTGVFTTLSATGVTTLSNVVLPVIDNIKLGYTTTATAAGTTTLTSASNNQQFFTGSTTQTVVLPVTSTLALGLGYLIVNNSTGVLTVQSSGGNTITLVPAGSTVICTCILVTGTTAASWSFAFEGSSNIPYKQVQSISASVAGNAMTISATALSLDFRSSTLSSGTVTTVSGTPANLVISSGSTLGTVNAIASRIVVIALNNAGTIELAAVNISGGNQLDETNLITTTAEGGAGAADSANVIYSTTARTSVAYRVIGFIDSTQATAGTWATAPSTIQGVGGQALSAMSSLGYGQTHQSLTIVSGTTYYNTTSKPILVYMQIFSNGAGTPTIGLSLNGGTSYIVGSAGSTAGLSGSGTFLIPPSNSYVITLTNVSSNVASVLR